MGFLLDRNEETNEFEVKHLGISLASFTAFSDAYARASRYAKNFQQKLFIKASVLNDWYVGFPKDKTQSPVLFQNDPLQVEASLKDYRFIEGPFESQEVAEQAAIKISGMKP
jgi:hypothetical protein